MAHENATPRPWRIGTSADNGIHCIDATDTDGSTVEICEVWGTYDDTTEDAASRDNAALIVDAVNQFDTLRAERDALREALAPFAAIADAFFHKYETRPGQYREAHQDDPDDRVFYGANGTELTFGDLRRARKLMEPQS